MRISFFCVIAVFIASSCSAPRYTASFTNYQKTNNNDYNSKLQTSQPVIAHNIEEAVWASNSTKTVELKSATTADFKTPVQIKKREHKEAIKKLRGDIKTFVKEQKTQVKESSYQDFEWDNDLKLAVIFGSAGLVGVLLGGISIVFSIIGGIALIIAVVFFVQWVLRQ